MKKRGSGLILGLSALGMGLAAGIISALFLRIIDVSQDFLWETGWADFQYAPLLICTLGGILVGLCQRYLGDYPKNLQAATQELTTTGRLEYSHLPHGLLTAAVSLIFGASLGPEAAIVSLFGGLGTWAADLLHKLRDKLEIPVNTTEGSRFQKLIKNWPNVLALVALTIIFVLGVKDLYSGGFLNMNEPFTWKDVLWSIPLGIAGVLFGSLYQFLLTTFQKMVRMSDRHPVARSAVTGIILGALASWLPMLLFSGQHDLQTAYLQAGELGAGKLALIALARIVLIALLLVSGWKGGQFLPLMFASTALGLAVSQMLPFISNPAGILAIMTGVLEVVLQKPIGVVILMTLMFPKRYFFIIIAAILTVYAVEKLKLRLGLPTQLTEQQATR